MRKLTLDRPVTYHIRVPGQIETRWPGWEGEITAAIESRDDCSVVTILPSTIDQAGLQSLLRRLYYKGLPIISVIYFDCE